MSDALGTIKSAYDLTKDFLELRDSTVRARKMGELQSLILQAQEQALASNEERATLVKKVGELEAEIARFKTWEAEKQRYELRKLPPGVFVYSLKPDVAASEPEHYLCERCYNEGKKALLHSTGFWNGQEHFTCHSCKTEVVTGHRSPRPMHAIGEYDPFKS